MPRGPLLNSLHLQTAHFQNRAANENIVSLIRNKFRRWQYRDAYCLVIARRQCWGSGMFITGSNFSIPVPDPGSRVKKIHSKEFLVFLTQTVVSKLSEIWSGLLIPDPGSGSWFLFIPDPGSRGQKGTGSQIPDPQHCQKALIIIVWHVNVE